MTELAIDIETYSSYSLQDCGLYRYVEAPDFAVLLFAYSIDHGPVRCVDIASGEELPTEVLEALTDTNVAKTAYNAVFERVCLSKFFGLPLDASQWWCTMARAAMMGLPLSLGQCGEVLGLEEGKMTEGRALIRYFSMPGKNGRHYPADAPDKWETFKKYNIRDVEVEQRILKIVKRLEIPTFERRLYLADQAINDRGVKIDLQMVRNAARFDKEYKERLMARAKEITGMENPNSPAQIKQFIHDHTGLPVTSLNKASLDELQQGKLKYWPIVTELLEIRKELGKTSNKKYDAMLDCVCDDGRIKGLMQYYGSRTGRWAGRLVQVQNLPQNHLDDIDLARRIVKDGYLEELEMNYTNIAGTLSELIRTAFVADEGKVFHVCDFSAIEARVIAWLAGEQWVLDTFHRGKDLYCETASKMFGVPVVKNGENGHLRQKGKIAVLALGYGGGASALEAMGGKRMGLTEEEEKEIVKLWRSSNKGITKLWAIVEAACITAIRTKETVIINKGIEVSSRWNALLIKLPSGRSLCYPRAKVSFEEKIGKEGIMYEGLSQVTKKWEEVRTYGGKLVENIVQAIARDILAWVILRAEKQNIDIVFHVHDEVVVEADASVSLQDVETLFNKPIRWAEGLPLKGVGYTTKYYLKD